MECKFLCEGIYIVLFMVDICNLNSFVLIIRTTAKIMNSVE
jgi:hypothetical protein